MGKKARARAFSIANLVAYGLGERSAIFRRLKATESASFKKKNEQGKEVDYYLFPTLPADYQGKIDEAEKQKHLTERGIDPALPLNPATVEETADAYNDAPEYNRRKLEKYTGLLKQFAGLKGRELKAQIDIWNKKHPGNKTSYPRIMDARKKVEEEGEKALIAHMGKRKGLTKVKAEHQEAFEGLYLKEGGPSAASCWRVLAGRFCKDGDLTDFPAEETFLRQTRLRIGESAIYLARNGYKAWDRKYGGYVDRDYSNIKAGECWISDHAQIDVAVVDPKTGKTVFPWLTSFVDMGTTKVMAAFLHPDPPNSDHIMQAFYMGVGPFGLPEVVYIDNGKDYRCRDFGGGKSRHKVTVDETKAGGMLALLGVDVIFALPYNAKAKNIERWHRNIKTDVSMHAVGYRGGNVTERPEKLAQEIKSGKILPFEVFRDLLYDWIENVSNKMPSKGKLLQGKSPDDLWNLENPAKRTISREALKLFCMRTSRPARIGRNGVKVDGLTYYAEWMATQDGRMVYVRRPAEDYNEAWCFTADHDAYIGSAKIAGLVPALAKTAIEKELVSDAIAEKRRKTNAVKELGTVQRTPDLAEIINDKKAAAAILNPDAVPAPEKTVAKIGRTAMDDVINQRRKDEAPESYTGRGRIAAELTDAKQRLAEAKSRIIQLASDYPEKQQQIAHWQTEVDRLQAEFNAAKVIALTPPPATEPVAPAPENSESGELETRRILTGQ